MALIYLSDVFPILISSILFSALSVAHRVLVPSEYCAILQYIEEADDKKTFQSTVIRVLYVISGTCILNCIAGLTGKQIAIGVFIACFLNLWPAIKMNRLMKLNKSKREWFVLVEYIMFIFCSVLISIITVSTFIPLLKGNITIYWFDNQAIAILISLFITVLPFPLEAVLSKATRIVIVRTVDTFLEEVYILEQQLNMESPRIKRNRYLIDNLARENDINAILLEAILNLEIFYRGRIYNSILEKIICQFFSEIAIKKDISVGIAQIRISTAENVLKEDSQNFIKQLCDDEMNIAICAKLLKNLINEYEDKCEDDWYIQEYYEDVYDYVACQYTGADRFQKGKTALVYGAVLRSFMKEEKLYYTGTEEIGRYLVRVRKSSTHKIKYSEFQEFLENIDEYTIKKEIYVQGREVLLELVCDSKYYIEEAGKFAEKYGCVLEVIGI